VNAATDETEESARLASYERRFQMQEAALERFQHDHQHVISLVERVAFLGDPGCRATCQPMELLQRLRHVLETHAQDQRDCTRGTRGSTDEAAEQQQTPRRGLFRDEDGSVEHSPVADIASLTFT
jgi:hypothetical protein